jgi:hypothetical protein
MDNERGWDPDVKKFLLKVLNSISLGLLWLMGSVTAGIYYKLAYAGDNPLIYTILFYVILVVTLALLIRYLLNLWKKE